VRTIPQVLCSLGEEFGAQEVSGTSGSDYHLPVILEASLELMAPAPGKVIVDGTLGGGGHSEAFLQAGATVIGLDQDPEAIAVATKRLSRFGDRFRAVHANFSEVGRVLKDLGINQIDGGFLDLGVSSWQLDTASRGFSFMRSGPLDMRMNPLTPISAADLVNNASEDQLARIFRNFGEESAANRIAARIVRERAKKPIQTTLDLANLVESVIPRRGKTHPATRVFQGLRIAVNRELEVLNEALEAFTGHLRKGGRFGVISFHSLEDRIVKVFFKQRSQAFLDRPEWPEPRPNPDYLFKLLTNKPVIAGEEEQLQNPRSRSAKLRVAEKI
jgi:16S rRNA (cytosine1402-N4)-methyltransferase